MTKIELKKLIAEDFSGEWGEDDEIGSGVYVIRAANFTSTGSIDYSKLVKRKIEEKKINQKHLQDGDIIIEKSGGGPNTPVGRVVQFNKIDNEIYLSNNFTSILRPDKDLINPTYLFYQLFYFYQTGVVKKYQNQTTGIYNLKLSRYLEEQITVPTLLRQAKIVSQLGKIQEVIAKRKKVINGLQLYLNSLFIEMFLESQEVSNWKFDTIDKLELIKKSTYGTAKKANSDGIGQPVIRMNNLSYDGDVSLEDIKWVDLDKNELARLNLEDRSILFNRTNSPDLVGKIAVWDKGNGYTFAGYLINLLIDEEKMSPYYFSCYFNSHFGKKVLKSKARPSGSLANISATTLKGQKLILPPIELQKKFEKKFLVIKGIRSILYESLSLLETFFQVILKNTFLNGSELDSVKFVSDIVNALTVEEFKNTQTLEILLTSLDKNDMKFSDFNNYNDAYIKLMRSLEEGLIEQFYHRKTVKIRVKK